MEEAYTQARDGDFNNPHGRRISTMGA